MWSFLLSATVAWASRFYEKKKIGKKLLFVRNRFSSNVNDEQTPLESRIFQLPCELFAPVVRTF